MLRAVLDANVIISGLMRPQGPPREILERLTAGEFVLVTSRKIAAEVERAFAKKRLRRFLPDLEEARLRLANIISIADLVEDTDSAAGVCRDPDDDKVLAAAVEGRAAVIVTGDHDLLVLGEYEGIAIVDPRAFLNLL